MFLSAPKVNIQGYVLAAGNGGRAALASAGQAGGGGGGSGGFVAVQGEEVTLGVDALLLAAGGGGGAGLDVSSAATAEPGSVATEDDPSANGGVGPNDGGDGSAPLNGSRGEGDSCCGGGGGGGGAGYIEVRVQGVAMLCTGPTCVPASTI